MPKLYGMRERRAQPVLDTLVREQPNKCICTRQYRDPKCPAYPAAAVKVVEIKVTRNEWQELLSSRELPIAIVKLPRFGLLARSKVAIDSWRRKQAELREGKRAAELQMLKELGRSSESVLRPFRRLVISLFGYLTGRCCDDV